MGDVAALSSRSYARHPRVGAGVELLNDRDGERGAMLAR